MNKVVAEARCLKILTATLETNGAACMQSAVFSAKFDAISAKLDLKSVYWRSARTFRCAGAAEINEVFISADSAETGNAKREPENRVPVSTK